MMASGSTRAANNFAAAPSPAKRGQMIKGPPHDRHQLVCVQSSMSTSSALLSAHCPRARLRPFFSRLAQCQSSFFSLSPKYHLLQPAFSGYHSFRSHDLPVGSSRISIERRVRGNVSGSYEPDEVQEDDIGTAQDIKQGEIDILKILQGANSIIPHVVLATTVLALIYPPSFTWFTTRYYAPALGFLMFAVGVNSSAKDFIEAFTRPGVILAGYVGQFIIKPLLGFLFGTISVTVFNLPTSIGAGIMLVSCVSGAQLSNYATFLTDPPLAPLSIVMTSLSTATAVLVTPLLSLLLIGRRLPVDAKGMMSSIMQIVVAPIAAGLLLNRFFPWISAAIRPLLPPLSVFVTALCVGSPLAININSILSPLGIMIVFLIIGFHASAFFSGYVLSGLVFKKAPDAKALQRTLSFETGMQSSLLALALANKFFQDPVVGVPPAISVVIMSLMGFSLVMLWNRRRDRVPV